MTNFTGLFAGRPDYYGTNNGGCVRGDAHQGMIRHLSAGPPIGIYPIDDHGQVRWGCVDIDIKSDSHPTYDYETETEAHNAALNLAGILELLGFDPWIEITRSNGRHIWVFSELVTPQTMREALLAACKLVDVPTSEVNPKQNRLQPGQLGNYVRLPYPYGAVYKQVMIDASGGLYTCRDFLDAATVVSAGVVGATAARYEPPETVTVVPVAAPPHAEGITKDLAPLGWHIFQNGPLPGQDRSGTLYQLASICKESRIDQTTAYHILWDADGRWGKFHDRPNGEETLSQLIAKAYQ